jgi:CubicO group peptidase (beta-lactamase class C family)
VPVLIGIFCPGPLVDNASDDAASWSRRHRCDGAGGCASLGLALIEWGELSWTGGFGLRSACAPEPEPVDGEAVFAVASLSKPPFAALVLCLTARGILNLDAPLAELTRGRMTRTGSIRRTSGWAGSPPVTFWVTAPGWATGRRPTPAG